MMTNIKKVGKKEQLRIGNNFLRIVNMLGKIKVVRKMHEFLARNIN